MQSLIYKLFQPKCTEGVRYTINNQSPSTFTSLVAKNVSFILHECFQSFIKSVNRVRSNALNTLLFTLLCEVNEYFTLKYAGSQNAYIFG